MPQQRTATEKDDGATRGLQPTTHLAAKMTSTPYQNWAEATLDPSGGFVFLYLRHPARAAPRLGRLLETLDLP